MSWPLVPVDGRTADWQRKIAEAINFFSRREAALTATTDWSALGNYANDAAAASGGVAVGELYRNGSVVQVRVT